MARFPPIKPLVTALPSDKEIAVWSDHVNKAVIIDLPVPMKRVGFTLNDAMAFRNAIDEQIRIISK